MSMNKTLLAGIAVVALTSTSYAAGVSCPLGSPYCDTQVTVTATRSEQLVKDVPNDTYIITRQDIDRHQAKTLGEALASVPGVQFSYDPHGGLTVTFRGGDARHTLVLINGLRTDNSLSGQFANSGSYDRINMDNVERIEVVQGASTAMYGSEAIGGVINIITKEQVKPGLEVNIERDILDQPSRYAGYRTSIALHSGDIGRVNANLSLNRSVNPVGFIPDKSLDTSPTGPRRPVHFDVSYKFGKHGQITYNYDHTKEKLKFIGFGGVVGAGQLSNITSTQRNITIKDTIGDTDIMARAYRSVYKDRYSVGINGKALADAFGQPEAYDQLMAIPLEMRKKMFPEWTMINYDPIYMALSGNGQRLTREGVEFQFDTTLGNHGLSYGAEFTKLTGAYKYLIGKKVGEEVFNDTMRDIHYPLYGETYRAQAYYLQDMWQVNPKLLLVGAIRYDRHNKYGNHLSPKVGFTYRVDKNTRWKGNIGYAFSAPHFLEAYAKGIPCPALVSLQANPNVKAEKATDFDIAFEKDLSKGSYKISAFHSKFEDYIQLYTGYLDDKTLQPSTKDQIGKNPNVSYSSAYLNIPHVTMTGVEISGKYIPNKDFDLFGSVTYVNAKDNDTGLQLMYRPRLSVTAGFNYHPNKWNLSFWGTYMGHYITSNFDDGPYAGPSRGKPYSVGVWNTMLSYHLSPQVTLYGGVDNIFNASMPLRNVDGAVYRFGTQIKI